jgi:hypothetical protein
LGLVLINLVVHCWVFPRLRRESGIRFALTSGSLAAAIVSEGFVQLDAIKLVVGVLSMLRPSRG